MLLSEVDDDGLRVAAASWLRGGDAVAEWIGRDSFSGADVVRLDDAGVAGGIVLKSFPAARRPHVAWVHGLMIHLRGAGCLEVPEVVRNRDGETIVADCRGRIWEGVRFVPGLATAAPTAAQARAATLAAARLHVAAASWRAAVPTNAVPAAVTRRVDQARHMLAEPWQPRRGDGGGAVGELHAKMAARLERATMIARDLELDAVLRDVAARAELPTPVQAVVRDLWSGHVLYDVDDPGRVAGIVDYQAAAVDTAATDLARLLGSWRRIAGASVLDAWRDAVDAYESIRPLTAGERDLVPWLDATATVFALDNWFRWVLAEGRRFEGPARIVERVDRLLDQLPDAAARLRRPPAAV